jgi:hypothetical protein
LIRKFYLWLGCCCLSLQFWSSCFVCRDYDRRDFTSPVFFSSAAWLKRSCSFSLRLLVLVSPLPRKGQRSLQTVRIFRLLLLLQAEAICSRDLQKKTILPFLFLVDREQLRVYNQLIPCHLELVDSHVCSPCSRRVHVSR